MANGEKTGGGLKRVKKPGKKGTSIDTQELGKEIVAHSDTAPPSALKAFLLSKGTVRHADVTYVLRQLILLLDAGTPILKALKTLAERGERAARRSRRSGRAAVRDLVKDIAQYVESGNPLWQAFDRHPRYFDTVFVNLIKASEASGTLVTVLRRVVAYREAREMLRKRVRGAMIYPVLLVLACFGVMLLLTNLVVPEFKVMFERSNLALPGTTVWFLWISDIFRVYWWVPIVVLIALVFVYKAWYVRNPLRRLRADRIKLSIPVVGPILHKNAIVELTRTLSLLLRSGLSMMATLDLTRNAIHNRAVAQTLQGVRDSVERGAGLEGPLREAAPVIPDEVTDMFVTGEESGSVDVVAEQIAEVFEEEVSIAVASLGEALQPIFTIIIGVAVLALFTALFWPLVSMIEQISSAGV